MGVTLPVGEYAGQGQTTESEGAPDQWYNCTIECLRRTALDLGFPEPYDDEQLRNDIRSRFGSTGLNWDSSIAIAQDRIAGLAQYMVDQETNDPVTTLRDNLNKGFICHIGLWCDTNAWVPPIGPITYSHACRVVADFDTGFSLQNPEPHPDFNLSDAQVRSLYDRGGILIFIKSLLPVATEVPIFSSDA